MADSPLTQAACLIEQAFALIGSSPDSLAALLVIEGVSRRADRSKIAWIATVERDDDGAVAGERPHLVVTIGLEDVEKRARGAVLATGADLTPSQLRGIACDDWVIPVVLGSRGTPLDVGRARRTASLRLR